ncbi:MAG TPA: hypothetical protein VK585_11795 [Jiangellaceae bacterium]|nr:hypothetical protein [Jiangellaceae bacterium]
MTTTPPPRPALRRADDGAVHPAAPHLSSLAVDVSGAAAGEGRRKGTKKDKDKAEETVDITVTLPKRDRKRLRRKAETYGWTAEEAASHVLRVWADD